MEEALGVHLRGAGQAGLQHGIAVFDGGALGHAVEQRDRLVVVQQGAREGHEGGMHVVRRHGGGDAVDVRDDRHAQRRATSTAFSPPKAKALDRATATSAARASFGTQSRSQSGSGVV